MFIKRFLVGFGEGRGGVEALSTETGRLEEIYRGKIEALEELKKSVLQRAFSGEL